MKRRMPIHTQVLIALALGAIAGIIAHSTIDKALLDDLIKNWASPIGKVFLYGIFMVVVPLLFSALALGVADLGDIKKVGRVGLRSLGFTLLLSGIAVGIGLVAVNVYNPASVLSQTQRAELIAKYGNKDAAEKKISDFAAKAKSVEDPPLLGFIPQNPFKEAVRALEGGLLPLMFFSLVFGIALAGVEAEKGLAVKSFLEGLFAVALKMIDFAMLLAPLGVFMLIFSAVASLGLDILKALGMYVAMVLVCLAVHQFLVYGAAIKLIAKRSPAQFFKQMKVVMLTAFATSSSNATLPTALKAATDEVGLPREVSSFVLTVGATANQNGTALYEGITIVFLCSMFGVPLEFSQQLMVMLLAIVAGIGTAGVPGGSLPLIGAILYDRFGVPATAIGLILGVDRILDMSRTVLNVTGDMTIAACVSAMEPELQHDAVLEAVAAS